MSPFLRSVRQEHYGYRRLIYRFDAASQVADYTLHVGDDLAIERLIRIRRAYDPYLIESQDMAVNSILLFRYHLISVSSVPHDGPIFIHLHLVRVSRK